MKWGDILAIRHNVLGRISWWQGGDPHKRTREARYYPHLAVVKTFKEGVNRVMGLFKSLTRATLSQWGAKNSGIPG